MKAWLISALQRIFPPVPAAVRGDLARLQYDRLRTQVPLLNITMMLTIIVAMLTATAATPDWVRYGIPAAIMVFGCVRSFVWSRRRRGEIPDGAAEAMVCRAGSMLVAAGALCSFWCVYTWFSDNSDYRQYAAMFMAMGAFATTHCLSVMRGVSIAALVVAMAPITLILLFSGEQMPTALGGSILVAVVFLIRQIMQQHDQRVEMLQLQKQMHSLARIDPLTGLLNRRALFEELEEAIGDAETGKRPAVAILDLDNFKPVNDGYGHAVGDALLKQVAERMQTVCGRLARIARLGGDEFAILASRPDHSLTQDIIDGVEATINLPFLIDDLQIHVGISAGMAIWSEDHIDVHCLLAEADKRLYTVKSERGGTGLRRSNFRAQQREQAS